MYRPGDYSSSLSLAWIDRDAKVEETIGGPGLHGTFLRRYQPRSRRPK
jgi:hypothetical protein